MIIKSYTLPDTTYQKASHSMNGGKRTSFFLVVELRLNDLDPISDERHPTSTESQSGVRKLCDVLELSFRSEWPQNQCDLTCAPGMLDATCTIVFKSNLITVKRDVLLYSNFMH